MLGLNARPSGASRGAACAFFAVLLSPAAVVAADKTPSGQTMLEVNWNDPELAAFRAAPNKLAGADAAKLNALRIPVIAFGDVPQIVKHVAGPHAETIEPRTIVSDPKEPFWYHLTDTYDGITVSVSADRRINHEVGAEFQIGEAKTGAAATLGSTAQPNITILDGETEEGMEGVILEYSLEKFPNIPYRVSIECAKKAKSQCKDLSIIVKDEALLKVIATSTGSTK